jgi:Family of unknown function (DUF6311)
MAGARPYISRSSAAVARTAWRDSVWFGLAISLVVGFVYALVLMGPAPLNPHNTEWMIGNPVDYYMAWALFRQDPHWHWPLTYTDRVGYPRGEAVALMDPNPLLVVLLKPFSRLLPEPFQFLGIEVVLLCALQFFFATRLFRLILGQNSFGIFLCSLFFLVSPAMAWHITRHYTEGSHWLLVASLLVYFQAQQESPQTNRRFVISALILGGVACVTNPYPALQVVLVMTAAAASLLWRGRMSLAKTIAFTAALGATCATMAYSLGFVIKGGKGYVIAGYRVYSLELLAPFDPSVYGSILPRLLPRFPHPYMDLGCVYLGAGVIFLGLLLLILFVLYPGKWPSLDRRWVVPLLLCCVVLSLLAMSTKIMVGHRTLLDLDPQQRLTPFLGALRMSVYLFWVPYYAILTTVLAAPFLFLRRWQANLLLAIVLVVQVVDIVPLLRWAHSRVVPSEITGLWKPAELQPLKSPIWSTLGSVHENLIVLPAWQCADTSTPGGLDGYRIFGLLAAAQKMRINGYHSGRYTEINNDFHCKQAIVALADRPLSPDTAYVVSPALAAVIAKGPTGPGKCHPVDGFILCSSRIDF